MDAIYDRRAVIWGKLIANAARCYGVDFHRSEVVPHPERPTAPLELCYHVDWEQMQQDAALVGRLFKAFADYSLVLVQDTQGRVVETRFARLTLVQEQIRQVLGLPQPAEIFARREPI